MSMASIGYAPTCLGATPSLGKGETFKGHRRQMQALPNCSFARLYVCMCVYFQFSFSLSFIFIIIDNRS